jgi:hypothetical protein
MFVAIVSAVGPLHWRTEIGAATGVAGGTTFVGAVGGGAPIGGLGFVAAIVVFVVGTVVVVGTG